MSGESLYVESICRQYAGRGRTGRDATSPRAARPASRVYSNVCLAEPDIDPYDTCVYVMELAAGPRKCERNYNGQKGAAAGWLAPVLAPLPGAGACA